MDRYEIMQYSLFKVEILTICKIYSCILPELQVYWFKINDVDCQIVVLLIYVGAQIEGIIYPRLEDCKRGSIYKMKTFCVIMSQRFTTDVQQD